MLNYENSQNSTAYIIVSNENSEKTGYFGDENVNAVQFGLEQQYTDDNNSNIITIIPNISDKKELIEMLLVRLRCEDVHPCTLIDIVEDYLVELAEI